MAIGDIIDIDIGGRAFMEVDANNQGGENPALTYAPVMTSAAFGSSSDAPWDGVSANPSMVSLLKKIALNTAP